MSDNFNNIIFQKKLEDARDVFDWYVQYIKIRKEFRETEEIIQIKPNILKRELKKHFRNAYNIKSEILPASQVNEIIDILYEEYEKSGIWDEIGLHRSK